MSHKFLFDTRFHSFLITIDRDLAKDVRQKGCGCGGSLHCSNYPRSPFGLRAEYRSFYEERISFCCNHCRRRITPPSVRYFGRRWYPGPLFLLISALMLSINEFRLTQIKRHFGIKVSESTWKRWRLWWRRCFVESIFWKQARALIPTAKNSVSLVHRLFNAFQGSIKEKLILLLQFLSPITASNFHVV